MSNHKALVRLAQYMATQEHVLKGQQTYDGLPYTHHLQHVSNLVEQYYSDPDLEVAAWIHDILEDTQISKKDILNFFGRDIYEIVMAVSAVEGKNRSERNAEAYTKIKRAGEKATALKLCDRLANMTWSNNPPNFYWEEYPGFKEALFDPNHSQKVQDLWLKLDILYAQHLHAVKS